jgi:hypothetical protein
VACLAARRARSSANSLRRRAPRKVTNLRYLAAFPAARPAHTSYSKEMRASQRRVQDEDNSSLSGRACGTGLPPGPLINRRQRGFTRGTSQILETSSQLRRKTTKAGWQSLCVYRRLVYKRTATSAAAKAPTTPPIRNSLIALPFALLPSSSVIASPFALLSQLKISIEQKCSSERVRPTTTAWLRCSRP